MPGDFAKALDWISIADIALQWSREMEDHPRIIEAVLYDYWERSLEEYGIPPEDDEWKFRDEARYEDALSDEDGNWIDKPNADDILISRLFVEGFCSSREMLLPKFWFAPERKDLQPSYAGRPSPRNDYVALFDECLRASEINLDGTLKQAANVLYQRNKSIFILFVFYDPISDHPFSINRGIMII